MSNEQKHTPGPWEAVERGDRIYIVGPASKANWHGRSGCWDIALIEEDVCEIRSDEERKANADVMAAAPDMLAALKEAREGLATFLQDNGYDVSRAPRIQAIDAAISKAEGTQP